MDVESISNRTVDNKKMIKKLYVLELENVLKQEKFVENVNKKIKINSVKQNQKEQKEKLYELRDESKEPPSAPSFRVITPEGLRIKEISAPNDSLKNNNKMNRQ